MLPTLLTARPGPQTLLLTALALLIAAATIMLACGPAAQPIPDAGDALPAAPQAAGGGEEPAAEPTDTPTPVPTVCLQGTDWDGTKFEHCITPIPPETPKYPNLSYELLEQVGKFEEAQEAQDAVSGASGQSGIAAEDPVVDVEVFFSSPNTDVAAAWLRSKGVLPFEVDREASTYFVEDVGYIGGVIPVSLMAELSRQEGVVEVRAPYPLEPTIVSEK